MIRSKDRKEQDEFLRRKAEEDRQKAILYKRVFCSDDGKQVLLDLMNRYFFMRFTIPAGHTASEGAVLEKGRREVVEDIMARANLDVNKLDELMKG
jgi:hypothetical protein